ncbi:MAG TPA: tetratricopeptide repeat protein [Stellaceae bacterium]|nr:tetratricopeptide repeat protein [Stellaceae bacterium]
MSPSADPPVYFLLHIPKTAGQTIALHLAEHGAPGTLWQPRRRPWPLRGFANVPDDLPRVRAVAGHDVARSLEARFRGRDIRRVVLLRDPLELQLSLYNYRMMNYLAKGLGTYGFPLHLRSLPRDYMAHLLLARWLELPWLAVMAMSAARKYEILNRMLAEFWFVGAHTDCDRLIATIAPDLGVPSRAAPRNTAAEWRKRVEWRPLGAADLTPAARAAILVRNPIDAALWESWRNAGFAARDVRPRPLAAPGRGGFLAHEIVRPGFVLARLFLRHCLPWLRRGAGGGIARGDRARDRGRWDLAARHYREALEHMPKAPAIWVQYGHALKEAGELEAAEAAYRRALALDPEAADTYLQLGHALKLQGRLAEAAAAYAECLARDPASLHAQSELAGLGWPAERRQDRFTGRGREAL